MQNQIKKTGTDYSMIVRNFTFGVEDSLVSTVGLLAGIAVAGVAPKYIFLTGFVLIFVEAFSMGVGSLLSEQTVEEYESNGSTTWVQPIFAAIVMFFSYVIAGLIPLLPYSLGVFTNPVQWSIVLTLFALFLLGVFNARFSKIKFWKNGLITLVMGGMAIAVGIIVGQIADKIR